MPLPSRYLTSFRTKLYFWLVEGSIPRFDPVLPGRKPEGIEMEK
jgi:hypothetical protein